MKSRKRSSLTLSAILTFVLHLIAIGPFSTTAFATDAVGITSLEGIVSSSGNYYLSANIVVSGSPAGGTSTYIGDFSGTLNGNGFTISGLSAPLFSDISGSVSNVNLITTGAGIFRVVADNNSNQENVGVLGAELLPTGRVSGVNVAGIIQASAKRYVGGLIGKVQAGARISNSSSSVSITTTSAKSTGGLVGYLDGSPTSGASVETSTSTGSVTTFGSREGTGGFVGFSRGSISILSSASSGNVISQTNASGQNNWETGGFLGSTYNGGQPLIKNSQALGSVTVTNSNGGNAGDVGGFIGYSQLGTNIQNVFASGNVTAVGLEWVGGLIGDNPGNVSNSIATGSVIGGDRVGGLTGGSEGSTSNSRASGSVSGISNFGALIGEGNAQPGPTPMGTDLDLLNTGQSPAAWGQDQNINGGKPYLLALINRGFYLVTTPSAAAPAAPTEAEVKAAAAAAAVKREAEVKTARADISKTLEKADKLTADAFAKADIAGVTSENIAQVQAEILALPAELRTEFNQVLKVARKYEVVGKIASEQATTLPITAFVEVGLIPADSKNKVALIAAIRRASADTRDSFADIQAVIAAEAARIQDRKDRLAATLARLKSK